ncbi:YkgJ family cysteine cluster protein [Roseibacterium sp. SDUM158016]|uniref:YkgJ family cysteine cluster protein n=1 Tax=Roseicyclus sediminis TaxID=2980997 RepID=UPI0021CDEF26|nr:YkgJ family cysteine cluster protein [Roseibacterium sp. SDUM158016]MCU4653553.1 YkgJ family cysteine cluster protein [Roseibacterium sp. SDUM158016]
MSSPTFDCTACGACCFGGHDRYVALLPEDRGRAIPETATTEIEGGRYMAMTCGHCAQLTATPEGRLMCGIYEERPEACRAFRAGSFECLRARAHRGPLAEALRAFAVADAPSGSPEGPVPVPPVVAAEGPPDPAHP